MTILEPQGKICTYGFSCNIPFSFPSWLATYAFICPVGSHVAAPPEAGLIITGPEVETIDLYEADDTAGGHDSLSPKKHEPSVALKRVKEELLLQSGEFSASTRDDLDTVADFQIPADIAVRTKVAKATEPQQSLSSGGGGSSSGGTPSGFLVRYPVFRDYHPTRFFVIHVPDLDVVHGSRLLDPTTCYSFLMKSIPPSESLTKSVTPSPELSDSAFTHLAGFQSDFAEITRRWACDVVHAANEKKVLQDRIKIVEADRDQLKKEIWNLKNQHIADGHAWKAADERTRKLLNSKIFELDRLRALLETKDKELEAAKKFQAEVETLRKELEATRHALALK
jgi:hypothetical protein